MMALRVVLEWEKPVIVRPARSGNAIYECNLDQLFASPGVYVFCRRWGQSLIPVYIGQANSVAARVKSQLNNLRLMVGLLNAGQRGDRVLLHGYASVKRGQQRASVLDVAERALIDKALADGHEILNKSGTKRRAHSVELSGNRRSTNTFGSILYVQSR